MAATTGGRILARALGARDLVLGLGAVRTGSAGWAAAGAGADALDALITLGSFGELPRKGRLAVLAAAGGSAIAGGVALRALRAG